MTGLTTWVWLLLKLSWIPRFSNFNDYLWFWPRRFLPPNFTKLEDVGANRYLMPLMRFHNLKTLRFIVPPPCRTLNNVSHDEQQFAMEQLMRFLRAKQILFGEIFRCWSVRELDNGTARSTRYAIEKWNGGDQVIEQAYLDTEILSFAANVWWQEKWILTSQATIYEEQFALLWTL